MAGIAGSVAPVFRDEGYVATATYDFYHAIIHNNKLYFCRQDGTIGHEPQETSDEYWFLSLDGNFGDAEMLGGETAKEWQNKIDAIITGTQSVGNAEKVGGYGASELAKADTFISGGSFVAMQNAKSDVWYRLQLNSSGEIIIYQSTDSGATWTKADNVALASKFLPLTGGTLLNGIELLQGGDETVPRSGICTSNNGVSYLLNRNTEYSKTRQIAIFPKDIVDNPNDAIEFQYLEGDGIWHIAKLLHSANVGSYAVLNNAVSDGLTMTVDRGDHNYLNSIDSNVPVIPAVANYTMYIGKYSSAINTVLAIGTDYTQNMYKYTAGTWAKILDSNNSAPVKIQSSAPSDTTVLWIDTTNKKVKAYIDGAWTVIA